MCVFWNRWVTLDGWDILVGLVGLLGMGMDGRGVFVIIALALYLGGGNTRL